MPTAAVDDGVLDGDTVPVGVTDVVTDAVSVNEGVQLVDAPFESVIVDVDKFTLIEGIRESVGVGVGVFERVPVPLVVAVTCTLSVIDVVPETKKVFDDEEDVPLESEHVGEPDISGTRLCVELDVLDKVGVPVAVALDVSVLLTDNVVVRLDEFVLSGVANGLKPRVAVGDGVSENEALIVAEKDAG